MMAPNMARYGWKSTNHLGRQKTENPSRINDLGFCVEPDGTSGDVLKPCHMWSIMT